MRNTEQDWRTLKGCHIFVTGGTGFYGKWLLEAIVAANDELDARIQTTVLSRNPQNFFASAPFLADRPDVALVTGEPATFDFPAGGFDYLVDFATPSAAELGAGGPAMTERCLLGTKRLLAFAKTSGIRRILYASSGAIYGRQPVDGERISEDAIVEPSTVSPYGKLKRLSEQALNESACECVSARGFAFLGPYLPLTDKFAAGSFLRDALTVGSIRIHGDGSQMRSYLYPADLAIWLIALLARGSAGRAYNVGSDQSITLRDLATAISSAMPKPIPVLVGGAQQVGIDRYVPNIARAKSELGLSVWVSLEEAIERSVAWARSGAVLP